MSLTYGLLDAVARGGGECDEAEERNEPKLKSNNFGSVGEWAWVEAWPGESVKMRSERYEEEWDNVGLLQNL